MEQVLFAFTLTLLAGLCTGIGSLMAFFTKKTNRKFLSVSLGFSAGVMIYVSMVELFADAKLTLITELGIRTGYLMTVVSFFCGMILIAVIDRLIPSEENPHELRNIEDMSEKIPDDTKLMRIGMMTALAVGIHNFPEGMATFMSALQAPSVAIPIAIAIAIHNIPEGIAISVPIFFATGDRKKAFTYSFLSGLTDPIGALIFYLLLMPFMSHVLMGVIFAGIAGIMVFISLDELLPSAEEYGEHHLSIYGMVAGMAVMALSLLLFV
ncbi:MAG TPA: zinc transporter ZupT [Clostridiaceae bacterium]|nr:zinc transporter ZupT [Clostridiaceae bacterium]